MRNIVFSGIEIMTSTDNTTTDRLIKEINLRTFADRYLDQAEEREVIRIASQLGVSENDAAIIIVNVCKEAGLVREADVREAIRTSLGYVEGKLDRPAFDLLVGAGMTAAKKTVSEREIQRMTIGLLKEMKREEIKRGWFSNWYTELKRELGIE